MRAHLVRYLLHLLAQFSLPTIHRLATLLGKFLAQHPKFRITQITQRNLQHCYPHYSLTQQHQLLQDSLIETCKTFMELGALWLWPVPKTLNLIQQISGEIHLQHAYQQQKGVILLTPHLGAWELAGLYTSQHYPLTALYRPPKLWTLQKFIHQARSRAGGRYVPTDKTGIRALYHTLQQNKIVGILPDQVPGQLGNGVFAPFFKQPAYTMTLVPRLAKKMNTPVILTYAQRLPQGQGFHLHFLPMPPNIASADLLEAVTTLNQLIQSCIETCPAQYQWSYKRFKIQPPETTDLY